MSRNPNDTTFDDQEVQDAPTDDTDTPNANDGSEPEEDADPNEGAEDQNDGEGDGKDGNEPGETEGKEEEGELDPKAEIASLKEELKTVKEILEKGNKSADAPPPQQHVYTEEEKAKISEAAGGASFETVQFFNNMLINSFKQIQGYVEAKFGEIGQSSAIEKFSKTDGFSDAVKYRAGMEEYLSKLPPQMRGKQDQLEIAYHVARSKGLKGTVQKMASNKDKNKQIVTQGRPRGGDPKGKGSVVLTDDERAMARAAGVPEAEYAKYKKPLRMIK